MISVLASAHTGPSTYIRWKRKACVKKEITLKHWRRLLAADTVADHI